MIDVSDYISQKVQAIAAHASQFPLKQDMLPLSILQELMGCEFFVARQSTTVALRDHHGFTRFGSLRRAT